MSFARFAKMSQRQRMLSALSGCAVPAHGVEVTSGVRGLGLTLSPTSFQPATSFQTFQTIQPATSTIVPIFTPRTSFVPTSVPIQTMEQTGPPLTLNVREPISPVVSPATVVQSVSREKALNLFMSPCEDVAPQQAAPGDGFLVATSQSAALTAGEEPGKAPKKTKWWWIVGAAVLTYFAFKEDKR